MGGVALTSNPSISTASGIADSESPPTARVVAVLEYLATVPSGSATTAELAGRLGITRSTCRAILVALEQTGYVERPDGGRTYRIGPSAVALGRAARERRPLLQVVTEILDRLCQEENMSCGITARSGEDLAVVGRIGSASVFPDAQRSGIRLPYAAPFGAPFAAWADEQEVAAWLERSQEDRTAQEAMRERLRRLREQGFLVQRLSAAGRLGLVAVLEDIAVAGGLVSERAQDATLLAHLTRTHDAGEQGMPAESRYATLMTAVMGADGLPALSVSLNTVRPGADQDELDELGARIRALMASASSLVYG